MKLTLGFSTCPNDTFIFDALVNNKIDTQDLLFEPRLADVEELNRTAFDAGADITKISYHAYAYIADNYLLLTAGSALGFNNGPLLVSKKKICPDEVNDVSIAIPGKYTTANLLMSIAWPGAQNRHEYLFSDIEDAVLDGEMDAGLLIHENRFTYEDRGLKKISDLGEYWTDLTEEAIPLGGIAIRRDIPKKIALKVNRLLRESIGYAFQNPESSYDYIKRYAVTMEREVMEKHISLYVNDYTLDLGERGKSAISRLYDEATERSVIPGLPEQIFVT
ncbi:MAG: 1,4-dihydroxy-6-naphthoate synthase [Bacteroidales bacterium]|nr:1,4-dihydroxy-6-naphthoate synthase [Bacteroidales bacterium]